MASLAGNKLVLIDGNSLVYRAFHAMPPLQSSSGEHTSAVYGFMNMLLKIIEEESPQLIAVAFDPPGPSFRRDIYREYKSQREKMPSELAEQMGRVKEILAALNIACFEMAGFEADDLIGTMAGLARQSSLEVIIVTGDADLLQLVGPGVKVLLTRKGFSQVECYDREHFKEQYSLEPLQMVDFKALTGDPSDNIPGVPGIGRKTASRLLQEHGSVKQLLAALPCLDEKLRRRLEQHREQLLLGQELVSLRRDLPLEISWDSCRSGRPDRSSLLELLERLEFKSLIEKVRRLFCLEKELPLSPQFVKQGEAITSLKQLGRFLDALPPGTSLAVTTEIPPGRLGWQRSPLLLALASGSRSGYYLAGELLTAENRPAVCSALAAVWQRGITMIGHDIKALSHLLQGAVLPAKAALPFTFDTQLAAYLLEPEQSGYPIERVLNRYLGLSLPEADGGSGKQKQVRLPEDDDSRGQLLAACACYLFPLHERLRRLIEERSLEELYYNLELPLAGVLARMERRGLTIDLSRLKEIATDVRSRLAALETEIYRLAGEQFNLNSPRQLADILFAKLKLPAVRKTRTGQSTDARVLEELAQQHEIVASILLYRQLIKLEGTYLSGLAGLADPGTGKIYTTFNQTITATGRLSSSEPNMQNIPVRLEEGRRIRELFVPSNKEQLLLAADYSQIELRIMAHLSQDPLLLEAFRLNDDIHRRTAAEVFRVSPEEVTPSMREKAKAVNFGIIYGISDYGLARGLGITRQEAQRYIDSYFERYSGVKSYIDQVVAGAKETGFVTTILNRRRYLPELRSPHFGRRSFAERIARNTPIQGSAADIIKLAMLRIDRLIVEGGLKANMLLQVHDELLFEIDRSELDFFAPVIQREMERAFELSVPLKVDLRWGENWARLK